MDKCKDCIHNSICTIHQQYYSITPDPHCGHYKPITDMISRESAKMGYSLLATYIFDEIEQTLKRKIARSKPPFEDLKDREKNLSIWGYKDMGYFQGIISTCEDLQDLIDDFKKKYAKGGKNYDTQ